MKPLRCHEIRGTWGTLLLPIRDDESIDLERLRNEIVTLAASGVEGIYSNGTAGEFHTQTEAEFDAVSELLATTCEARNLPFQIGASHMSAQISLERIRRARSLKPSAFQVILPDWVAPTLDEVVAFLSRLGEAASPVGLIVYNPPSAKKVLRPDEWLEIVAKVPAVLGVKVAGGDAEWYRQMRPVLEQWSVFVAGHTLATGVRQGATGAYSNVACLNPSAATRWYHLMLSDPSAAAELEGRIQAFFRSHIIPFVTTDRYSNAAVDKLLAAIGGWADVGTRLRWPYRWMNPAVALRLREVVRRELPEFVPADGWQ